MANGQQMKYEYKVVKLNNAGDWLMPSGFELLQQWFDNGWEYVETFQQRISGSNNSLLPAVAVIIKREKTEEIKL